MRVKISVPSTSANIGPGFDIWGLALEYKNEFICTVDNADDAPVDLNTVSKVKSGKHEWNATFTELVEKTTSQSLREAILDDRNNLVIQSYEDVFKEKQIAPPAVTIQAKIGIPVSRGLGSSSTAILAGMVLANEVLRKYYEDSYSMDELFNMACKKEGHPDNIAPALYGGWVLSLSDNLSYKTLALPLNAPVQLGGIVPHVSLSTEEARKVIQHTQPLEVCAFQASRTAALTHLLGKKDWTPEDAEMFGIALADKIHQDARAALIPGLLETITRWKAMGAYGAYLSGAGTTILGFWPKNADLQKIDIREPFLKYAEATQITPKIDRYGLNLTYL